MGYTRKVSKFEIIQFIEYWAGNKYGSHSKLKRMHWSELWEIAEEIMNEEGESEG